MFSDKKAMDNMVLIIIVVMVSLLVILATTQQIQGSVKESTEGLSCKAMLVSQDMTQSSMFIPNFKNACSTVEVRFSLDDKDKDDVMRKLAKVVAEAWWTTNEGRTKGMWSDKQYLLAKQGYDCLVRYHIIFEDADKKDFDEDVITKKEFTRFLEDTYKNDEYTYHMYLQAGGADGSYEIDGDIDVSENGPEYVVSIASPKLSHFADKSEDLSTAVLLSTLEEGIDTGCELI